MKSGDLQTLYRVMQEMGGFITGPAFILLTVLIMLATYALDVMTPLGMPVWLLYFIPLFLSFWSDREYAVPSVCIVTLLFLAAGLVFSPPGVRISIALFIRVLFAVIVIAVSAALKKAQRTRIRAGIIQAA